MEDLSNPGSDLTQQHLTTFTGFKENANQFSGTSNNSPPGERSGTSLPEACKPPANLANFAHFIFVGWGFVRKEENFANGDRCVTISL